ncbi:Pol polyprotein, partial [Mucuna pruriens]
MTHCQYLGWDEVETNAKPWYHDIIRYLEKGVYLDGVTENDKRTLRRLASSFFLSGMILYKRSVDMTLLHCIDDQEAKEIMEEVHEGTFGTHTNDHALAQKILRVGYYWTKMESDCYQHMKRCMKCQICADNIHAAPSALHNLTSLWAFSMHRHRFILVAIDYFTKWVEVASYPSVTKNVVVKFINKDIICRYDLPVHIITDNGTNLNNKMITNLCEQLKICHHNYTPYRLKMNGAVKAANKNIKKIVQKMVVTYKYWHDIIHRGNPYSLVNGTKVVLLIEVEIPSLKVLVEVKLEEAEWIQNQLDQLNLIDKKWLTALCHE